MIVTYAATRNLYPYMLPSIVSLMEHNEVETIYLLIEDDALPYPTPKQCKCINVSGQTIFPKDGVNYRNRFTYMVLMRTAYTRILPVGKVLQLDVDTIITDSLEELWNTDLEGKWFAAVNEDKGSFRPYGPEYYNFGVVLFNLDQIKKDGIEDKLIYNLNNKHYQFLDQDAWNEQKDGKVVRLPSRFNECFATNYSDDPAIVHYAGYPDWMTNGTMPRVSYLEKYKHLYMTGKTSPPVCV